MIVSVTVMPIVIPVLIPRGRQAGVQLSGVRDALTDNLSGIVDRESTRQLHKRPWIADESIEVLRLGALPYEGAPEVRIVRLDTKADDLASIIVRPRRSRQPQPPRCCTWDRRERLVGLGCLGW